MTNLKHTDMFPSAKTLKARAKARAKYKYTINTGNKVHEFKTLKQAREFAQYLEGMSIISQVRI
jgi:hypothetical protein